ncbi:DUF5677 domain-containing protein [Myxococcus xanthus]|uniref:DUF5677 domain-containing protein n=1 Tax=Myxococcus xanthus TaxID=34 RepID=UPI0013763B58|nr:DUF5677 domain-containing protein [Myxococcus xanthus]
MGSLDCVVAIARKAKPVSGRNRDIVGYLASNAVGQARGVSSGGVMGQYPDVAAYWKKVAPRLDAHLEGKRNRGVEDLVAHSFAFYSFVQEEFSENATRNQNLLKHMGIMLVHVQDVVRGLMVAQAQLSPVVSAALLRIALEVRCNQLFIIRNDSAKYADRFARYAGVERLLRDEYAPPGAAKHLSPAEEQQIRVACAEWFNSKGKVRVKHWTAEEEFKSLKSLADSVGLADEYLTVYGIGSKFVHGSSLLENLYSSGGAIGALANPGLCSKLSMLGVSNCIHMIREAAEFFGVPFPMDEHMQWQARWMQCYQEIES